MTRRVEVYWNLRVKAFSVREGGQVVGHAKRLLIRDAKFSVGQAGRRKVLETGQKNVHAFIRGELSAVEWQHTFRYGIFFMDNWTKGDNAYATVARKRLGTEVRYNPRKDETFVDIFPTTGARKEAPMAYLRRVNESPVILAFDPCLMTEAESRAATF